MIDAISTALSGLTAATRKVNASANNIANPQNYKDGNSSLIKDIVDIKVAETEFKANVHTIKVAEELSDELLKIFDKKV